MKRPMSGHTFEAGLLRCLRLEKGCEVFTSEAFDNERKVDGEIRVVSGAALALPVQFQVTTRLDHYTKLRKYLKTRRPEESVVSLYVEAELSHGVQETADDLVWAAVTLQTLPPFGTSPLFGLRIGEDAVFFDPCARLEELRLERESPERRLALRRGLAHSFEKERFVVSGEDGSSRIAHFIDVDDGAFRERMRDCVEKEDASFPVWYLPSEKFARDVRPRPADGGPDPA